MKAREVKRAKLVAKYAAKHDALKAAGDYEGLQLLPKNASKVRMHNRCSITGRPERLHASVRTVENTVPRDGLSGSDPGCQEGELVIVAARDALPQRHEGVAEAALRNYNRRVLNIVRIVRINLKQQ